MTSPKILVTTYHQAFFVRGGGEYEMFSIVDSLKQKGFVIDIYSPYSRNIENYDIILHFSVHGGGINLLREVKRYNKPIILWPNLWVIDRDDSLIELVNEHVALSEMVVFKSKTELNQFNKLFDLSKNKVILADSGVDSSYCLSAPVGLFKNLYNLDEYAIWCGVIEPNKNQLAAIRVLEEKKIPLVLVGGYREKQYYEKCLSEAKDDVLFIESLPSKSEIIRSALREALFYIELPLEPPGLSAIEAGLSGCRLLLSDSEWSREYFENFAVYANPLDDRCISSAVDKILKIEHNPVLQAKKLKRYCLPFSIEPLIEYLKKF